MKAIALTVLMMAAYAHAEEKIKFNFNNEEVTKVIEIYSKSAGQKVIVDPVVRGRISIFNPAEVTLEEAFNELSEGLAVNGFAVVKNGDVYTIKNARSVERDNIQVSTEVPAPKPQRMVTWIISLKNADAWNIASDVRLFTSPFGEMSLNTAGNQLIITDWASNLQRVAEVIKNLDKPVGSSVAKIVAAGKKERKDSHESNTKKKNSGSAEAEPEKEKSKN